MPSPFPGMDPYLEDPALWPDVHHALIGGVQEQLTSKLRVLKYAVRVELLTFMVEEGDPASALLFIPDARIVEREGRPTHQRAMKAEVGGVAVAEETTVEPIDVTGLVPRVTAQRYLEIRDADRRVVTVIEIVSPSNKVAGSKGRKAFLEKRDQVGDSETNWFEIDLLRRGTPTINLPIMQRPAYRAYADRTTPDGRRQLAWPIRLRERLPRLPIPLRPGEPDVALDLHAVLDAAYDRAGYDLDIDYNRPPSSPLNEDDAAWAAELLKNRPPSV